MTAILMAICIFTTHGCRYKTKCEVQIGVIGYLGRRGGSPPSVLFLNSSSTAKAVPLLPQEKAP